MLPAAEQRNEEQKNRGTKEQKNRGTEEQKNRGTEEQKNRGTDEQMKLKDCTVELLNQLTSIGRV